MKKIFHIYGILISMVISIILSSCSEDVINIDLKNARSRIVIEGKVVEGNGPHTVKITRTADFFKPSDFIPVTGAVVKISDDAGNTETLSESEPGLYAGSTIVGVPGKTYTMTVNTDDNVYTASSLFTSVSKIDSLSFEEDDIEEDTYIVHCYFTDTKDSKEYARFKMFINGEQYHDYYMYQDRLTDGKSLDYEFYLDEEINNGDIIVVEMQTIDRPVYEFFNTLQDALISPGDAEMDIDLNTPGNPVSNISNDALGYFSAFASNYDTLIVKK